jgi:hypothetical protein
MPAQAYSHNLEVKSIPVLRVPTRRNRISPFMRPYLKYMRSGTSRWKDFHPSQAQIAKALGCHVRTVIRLQKKAEGISIRVRRAEGYRITCHFRNSYSFSMALSATPRLSSCQKTSRNQRFSTLSVTSKKDASLGFGFESLGTKTPLVLGFGGQAKAKINGFFTPATSKSTAKFRPPTPLPWSVEKALNFFKSPKYLPLYFKAQRTLGDDFFQGVIRDAGDDFRALAGSERPIKCRAALFHWRINRELGGRGPGALRHGAAVPAGRVPLGGVPGCRGPWPGAGARGLVPGNAAGSRVPGAENPFNETELAEFRAVMAQARLAIAGAPKP